MSRSRRNLNDSRPVSPTSADDSSDDKRQPERGRQGKPLEERITGRDVTMTEG